MSKFRSVMFCFLFLVGMMLWMLSYVQLPPAAGHDADRPDIVVR